MQSLRIISPNGHLGFAPIRTGSFDLGVAAGPHYIAADSGSDDVGPVPLDGDIFGAQQYAPLLELDVPE